MTCDKQRPLEGGLHVGLGSCRRAVPGHRDPRSGRLPASREERTAPCGEVCPLPRRRSFCLQLPVLWDPKTMPAAAAGIN